MIGKLYPTLMFFAFSLSLLTFSLIVTQSNLKMLAIKVSTRTDLWAHLHSLLSNVLYNLYINNRLSASHSNRHTIPLHPRHSNSLFTIVAVPTEFPTHPNLLHYLQP